MIKTEMKLAFTGEMKEERTKEIIRKITDILTLEEVDAMCQCEVSYVLAAIEVRN